MAKVSHIVLPVADVRESRDWYVDKLRRTMLYQTPANTRWTPPSRRDTSTSLLLRSLLVRVPVGGGDADELRRSDCSRISGLSYWSASLRAMMKSAHGEPIVAPARSGHVCYRLSPAPV